MERISLFVLLLSVAGFTSAMEVYRCAAPEGNVSFQQSPCEGPGIRVETGEVQTPWTALRSGERQLYQGYRRRDRERTAARRSVSRRPARREERGSVTCYNKSYQLGMVRARLRAGYRPEQGESLRRRRDYLEGYLRRFCRD